MKVQVIVAAIWLTVHSKQLKMYEKAMLCNGEELNNRIINAAQKILYYQFPSLQGSCSRGHWFLDWELFADFTLPFFPLGH